MEDRILAGLLDGAWDFAKLMLSQSGEFHPFAHTANPSGESSVHGAYDGQDIPKGSELYALLQRSLSEGVRSGKVSAVALVANVTIPASLNAQFPDGIRVHLESEGFSRMVYLPYRIESESGRVTNIEPLALDIPAVFFKRRDPT